MFNTTLYDIILIAYEI